MVFHFTLRGGIRVIVLHFPCDLLVNCFPSAVNTNCLTFVNSLHILKSWECTFKWMDISFGSFPVSFWCFPFGYNWHGCSCKGISLPQSQGLYIKSFALSCSFSFAFCWSLSRLFLPHPSPSPSLSLSPSLALSLFNCCARSLLLYVLYGNKESLFLTQHSMKLHVEDLLVSSWWDQMRV